MNFRHIATAATIAIHDISTAHNLLKSSNVNLNTEIVLIRHLILGLANIADLAINASALYKENKTLCQHYKKIKNNIEFFKYLRNVYVAHFVPELTDKTFEWQPILNDLIGQNKIESQMSVSWLALETAINTFSDPINGHKIFDSETDLYYPPDYNRFLNYLYNSVEYYLDFAFHLIEISCTFFHLEDFKQNWRELCIQAGKTDFQRITKNKR